MSILAILIFGLLFLRILAYVFTHLTGDQKDIDEFTTQRVDSEARELIERESSQIKELQQLVKEQEDEIKSLKECVRLLDKNIQQLIPEMQNADYIAITHILAVDMGWSRCDHSKVFPPDCAFDFDEESLDELKRKIAYKFKLPKESLNIPNQTTMMYIHNEVQRVKGN